MKIARAIGIFLLVLLGWTGYATAAPLILTWQDNSNNETGFEIQKCLGSGCSNFTVLTNVGANVQTFTDTSVGEAVTACYKVRAFNATAFSDFSNTACGTSKLNAPTNVQVQSQ